MSIYFDLFLMFFKIGLFTFGGGYAILPLIQEEVLRRDLMSLDDVVSFVAVSESTPGPFAVNIATYVGLHSAGIAGSVVSTLGVVLPSFLVILLVARAYEKFRKNRFVEGAMTGLRPAVVGLLACAVLTIGKSVFFHDGFAFGAKTATALVIFALVLFLSLKKKISPILLILLSAALGLMGLYALEGLKVI